MRDLIKGCRKHRKYCEKIGIKDRTIGSFTEQFPNLRYEFMQKYIGLDREAILDGIEDDLKSYEKDSKLIKSLTKYYSSIVIKAQQAKKDEISGRGTPR